MSRRIYSIYREERGRMYQHNREDVYSIGVRDVPYGIWFPRVRVGWGVDALGKLYRRRRHRGLQDHKYYNFGLVL